MELHNNEGLSRLRYPFLRVFFLISFYIFVRISSMRDKPVARSDTSTRKQDNTKADKHLHMFRVGFKITNYKFKDLKISTF
jgi:hypothetical protein